MAKTKRSKETRTATLSLEAPPQSTSALRTHAIFGYKIRVLIYDLRNLAKDSSSAKRLNATLDEHYISPPYFTPAEAEAVKNAMVDVEINPHVMPEELAAAETITGEKTVKEAISKLYENFLEKRRASGDARPCGPHDLAPLYAALFGIKLEEVQDDKFLGRLRRNGV